MPGVNPVSGVVAAPCSWLCSKAIGETMADNCLPEDVNGGKIVAKRRAKQPATTVDCQETLMQLAMKLRDTLHGFVALFDEHDPVANAAIREFDEFVGGVELVNRSTVHVGD